MRKFFLATILVICTTGYSTAQNVKVTITGIHHNTGKILIMMQSNKADKPYQNMSEVTTDSCNFIFKDVNDGTYKISAFHDENGNYQIDKDEKGIPTEGFVMKTITIKNGKMANADQDTTINLKLFYPKSAK
jgi:uncharacterized protein (DUF2141 family)